jgi:uncharacterized protein DUF6600/FecR-like protein
MNPNRHMQHGRARIFALLLGFSALVLAGAASADPPTRVARLGYTTGAVSFSPAGENDWLRATMNRPLITGDRLWVDARARAELQIGSAVIRMSGSTSVTLLNLEDRVAQVQLSQGTLNIRVRRLGPNEVLEIATPNLAYSIRRPGRYRIEVDAAGDATTVVVREGQAEVYGERAAYRVNAGQTYRFFGTDLRDYEYVDALRADEFDRWSSDRDRRGSVSARYVSSDVIGYEDLDEYGSWRPAQGYGNVWVPTRVASGWAPYRDGHWAWVDPWGWTWVDDAPWGFAVSHYGRWANINGTWSWVPGPVRSRAVYAPALVVFIVGAALQSAFSGDAGGIAWFPLGPRDVYRPSYPVSRRYFNDVNTSNTTINTTTITNVYNVTNVRNITYVNQQVPGAIVAVPSTAFVQSQPVARAAVRVTREAIASAPVTTVAAVAPVQASVRGAAAAGGAPPAQAQQRPVVVKAPPPPAPVPFAAKQSALAANPGKPLDAAALATVKPSAPAPAPAVKVVAPTQPAAAPPKQQAVAPGARRAAEAQKGAQPPEAQQPQPSEAGKGRRAREAQQAAPPPVSAPRAPETQAPLAPASAPKPAEAPKAALPEAQKAPPPPVSAPKPAEAPKAPSPEAQKAPPADVQKGRSRDADKAPPPPVSAPKPAEAPKAPSPEAQKAPAAPAIAPKPPEAPKAPPSEAQKAPPADVQKGRSRDADKAPPPPASAPKPPETPKAPSPEAQKAPPADVQKGRSRDADKAPPPPVSAPKPPEAQTPPPKPEAGKSAGKRGERKSDEQLKLEEKLRLEEKLKLEEKLRLEEKLKREEEDKKRKQ